MGDIDSIFLTSTSTGTGGGAKSKGKIVPISFVDKCLRCNAALRVKQENPKRGMSAYRYDMYKSATTIRQVLDLGAKKADLQFDLQRRYMNFEDPRVEAELEAWLTGQIQEYPVSGAVSQPPNTHSAAGDQHHQLQGNQNVALSVTTAVVAMAGMGGKADVLRRQNTMQDGTVPISLNKRKREEGVVDSEREQGAGERELSVDSTSFPGANLPQPIPFINRNSTMEVVDLRDL